MKKKMDEAKQTNKQTKQQIKQQQSPISSQLLKKS